MPKNHARKNQLTALTELGVKHADAIALLDHPDVGERYARRSGPGAGRPSTLYRRSARHVAVSLPEHRYDLAGGLLATAIEPPWPPVDPTSGSRPTRPQLGNELAVTARGTPDEPVDPDVMCLLEEQGFEPRTDENVIALGNCPLHALAKEHTDLVCEMNLCVLIGLLAGLGATHLQVQLKPESGNCCVRLEPATTRGS